MWSDATWIQAAQARHGTTITGSTDETVEIVKARILTTKRGTVERPYGRDAEGKARVRMVPKAVTVIDQRVNAVLEGGIHQALAMMACSSTSRQRRQAIRVRNAGDGIGTLLAAVEIGICSSEPLG